MKVMSTTVLFDKETGNITTEKIPLEAFVEAAQEQQKENECICIYPSYNFQKFEGYGCALTESSCYLLSKMEKRERERALRCWFGPEGMDADFVRIHIDSCDYSLEEYQAVCDPIADPELTTFTLDRDRMYIIPVVKEAMALTGKKLSVLLSPWSPPSAWKTPPELAKNDAATYGAFGQEVDLSKPGRCFGGRLKKQYYGPWAKYLVKYVKGYLQEGIPVTMLSAQNESAAATSWDSCLWSAGEQAEFVRDHLYPQMKEAGLTDKVGLYAWDHNKERLIEYIDEMMEAGLDGLLEGFAYHWYSGDHFEALSMLRQKYPDKVLMHSESCGLHIPGKALSFDIPLTKEVLDKLPEAMRIAALKPVTEVDLADAVAYAHDFIGDLKNGMNRWIDWNLIVDRKGGPRHVAGGFAAPLIYEDNGTFTRTVSYEWLLLMAKTIRRDAVIIGTSSFGSEVETVAARNTDGSIGILLLNRCPKETVIHIRIMGHLLDLVLKPDAFTTLVLSV